jgi:hypothetical protein
MFMVRTGQIAIKKPEQNPGLQPLKGIGVTRKGCRTGHSTNFNS